MKLRAAALFSLVVASNASAEISGRYYDPEYTKDPEASCGLPSDSVVIFTKQSVEFHENLCRVRKVERWPASAATYDYFLSCSNGKRQRLIIEETRHSIWIQWTQGKMSKTSGTIYRKCPANSNAGKREPTNATMRSKILPTAIGQCTETTIKKLSDRFGKPLETFADAASGTIVELENGGFQISYDRETAVVRSRIGDTVRMCLKSKPEKCPAGDYRGRIYTTTNLRTGEAWTLPDSQHRCGGA